VRKLFGGELKFFVTGSAVLKPEVARFFRDVGQPTYDCYGMTETAPTITVNSPKYGNKYGSVGKPVPGMHVVIDKSRVGEDSQDGEVIAYGAHVMMGYHGKPDATAEVMMPDTWNGFPGIRTGDRGWLDEEGYLHITGRFKDEYKLSNGKYVHPEHIENELRALPFVANAMLYGDRRDYNVALIVPNVAGLGAVPALTGREAASAEDAVASKEVRSELAASISAHLRKHFGGYEVPRRYLFVAEDFTLENGLLTQTLKLKRFNILRKYEAQLQALYES
jgi:long-chain acyl-CoA synthetase